MNLSSLRLDAPASSCDTESCTNPPRGKTSECNACRQRRYRASRPSVLSGTAISPPVALDEFLSNIGPPNARGCREWTEGRFRVQGVEWYGAFWVAERRQNIGAHRLAFAVEHGEVPAGSWVLHRCDNPPCCEPTHLYLGDHDQNTRDRVERHRGRTGERHHGAKLTEAQVVEYRRRYREGESVQVFLTELGMTLNPVYNMLTGRNWAEVPGAVARTDRPNQQARGETAGLARLTESQVREARRLHAAGVSHRDLGLRFGVSKSAMRQAVTGQTWAHII